MNTIFTINFRREAYQNELARARRRVISLGVWVAYFGVLGVVLGLYGLNCTSLAHRTQVLEHQIAHLKAARQSDVWRPGAEQAGEAERHLRSARAWHDRFARLPQILPANARLTSVQYNPDNASGAADVKLVLTGELRSSAGQDRMQQVMTFVNALSRDSVFSVGYKNIRLVTTRAATSGDGAEFVIECR